MFQHSLPVALIILKIVPQSVLTWNMARSHFRKLLPVGWFSRKCFPHGDHIAQNCRKIHYIEYVRTHYVDCCVPEMWQCWMHIGHRWHTLYAIATRNVPNLIQARLLLLFIGTQFAFKIVMISPGKQFVNTLLWSLYVIITYSECMC